MDDQHYDPSRLQLGNRAELNLPEHAIRERDYLCGEIISAQRFRNQVCSGLLAAGMLFQMFGFTSAQSNAFTGYFSIGLGGLMILGSVILFIKKNKEIAEYNAKLEAVE